MLPLYKDTQTLSPKDYPTESNAGLWYDKFCNKWNDTFDSLQEGGKLNWINGITSLSSDTIDEFKDRQYKLINIQAGIPMHFKLTSSFVTGLGREHPVENGFAWHHTLGVPYLPGTSVKGIVRAWAKQWDDNSDENSENFKRILGCQDSVGSVIFLDAIPVEPVQLQADVMTPHYTPYYKADNPNENPPADWYSPTPIPFLVVAPGSTFQFGILPKHADKDDDKNDCQKASEWLKEALEWIGAGAKTSVGYGRFSCDKESQEKAERAFNKAFEERQKEKQIQDKLKGKSDIAKKLIEQANQEDWENNKDAFAKNGVIEGWLDRLEKDPQPDAIEFLSELVNKHFPDLLDNPDATEGKRNKPKFKPRQKEFANRLLQLLKNKEK